MLKDRRLRLEWLSNSHGGYLAKDCHIEVWKIRKHWRIINKNTGLYLCGKKTGRIKAFRTPEGAALAAERFNNGKL